MSKVKQWWNSLQFYGRCGVLWVVRRPIIPRESNLLNETAKLDTAKLEQISALLQNK